MFLSFSTFPMCWKFAGKVSIGTLQLSRARAIKSALEIKDGISQRKMNLEA